MRAKQLFMLSSVRIGYNSSLAAPSYHLNVFGRCFLSTFRDNNKRKSRKKFTEKKEDKKLPITAKALVNNEKRRTRSSREYVYHDDDDDNVSSPSPSTSHHVPVMLGEVVDVFATIPIHSFVDCTIGAAGHSSALIHGHPELRSFVGMDVDPAALKLARARLDELLLPHLRPFTFLKNFKSIKSVLAQVDDEKLVHSGVDGILMDLGMSSMQVNNPERGFSVLQDGPLDMRMDPQASLKAEDILNSWPETELGRVLREYGEESNWNLLQRKIVKARLNGGLHSTSQLVDLIKTGAYGKRGSRQGWIKTATRVFQGLRIAVNDELKTLEDSLYASFDCLAPGGRLAVISFHSLEDRIVKQTFLDIVNSQSKDGDLGGEVGKCERHQLEINNDQNEKEKWIRQTIEGLNGIILTKRPITPSEDEEKLNRRSRSAKLRVIQKV